MSEHAAAEEYLRQLRPPVGDLAWAAHDALVDLGCGSYVKTIYIGYDLGGEMVAALYGHTDHVEVALALPETAQSAILVDATHLTWRTLPLAALVRAEHDVPDFVRLAAMAAERVKTQMHDVALDNDHFIERRRGRRGFAATRGGAQAADPHH